MHCFQTLRKHRSTSKINFHGCCNDFLTISQKKVHTFLYNTISIQIHIFVQNESNIWFLILDYFSALGKSQIAISNHHYFISNVSKYLFYESFSHFARDLQLTHATTAKVLEINVEAMLRAVNQFSISTLYAWLF